MKTLHHIRFNFLKAYKDQHIPNNLIWDRIESKWISDNSMQTEGIELADLPAEFSKAYNAIKDEECFHPGGIRVESTLFLPLDEDLHPELSSMLENNNASICITAP